MRYLFAFVLMLLVGCATDNPQLANPASVFCKENGNSLEMVNTPDGTQGFCVLGDGTRCDEWEYYRGECPKACASCPVFSPPAPDFCKDGKIVAGAIDDCGCQMPPGCEPVACTLDAKVCPDGTSVARVAPDCEFALCPEPDKNYCTSESRKAKICKQVYLPVCGWFSSEIKCIRYPCAVTESNGCTACINPNVEYWTDGECPKG